MLCLLSRVPSTQKPVSGHRKTSDYTSLMIRIYLKDLENSQLLLYSLLMACYSKIIQIKSVMAKFLDHVSRGDYVHTSNFHFSME